LPLLWIAPIRLNLAGGGCLVYTASWNWSVTTGIPAKIELEVALLEDCLVTERGEKDLKLKCRITQSHRWGINMKHHPKISGLLRSLALLCMFFLRSPILAYAQASPGPSTAPSYSFFDVLTLSAIGGNVPAFTPLSLGNFTEGWFEPWSPPPNGELHLQRGGWVNTDSAFFSREIDPSFSFNAGTSGSRDEYIGATSLFIPFNRRLQLGLSIPFVDSLQGTNGLPSATSFGDIVVIPQLMLEETESRSVSALLAIRTPTGETKTGNDKTILTPTLALWQDLPARWQLRGGVGMDLATHNKRRSE
jgi:hypothetical protein